MFNDITTPSIDELQKYIKELENENCELEKENIMQRRRMAKDLNDITEMAHIIKKCENEFGEEKIKKIHNEVKKELRDVGISAELEEED